MFFLFGDMSPVSLMGCNSIILVARHTCRCATAIFFMIEPGNIWLS